MNNNYRGDFNMDVTQRALMGEGPLDGVGTAKPNSKLPIDQQTKELIALAETLNELEDRLNQVLTPPYPTEANHAVPEDASQVSPLADQLHINNQAIYQSVSRLKYLMDRLEC